jgi:cation-transporting P-type ATPase E
MVKQSGESQTMENINLYSERFHPDYSFGLSHEQVASRRNQGLANGVEESGTRTIGQIVRSNLITPFNILNLILAAMIVMVGSYKNLLFLGVIVCNTLIGTIQEIRAKKTIDRLSLITAPKAHVVRDGKKEEIPVSELVLDDVMVLETGNQVCADCIILNGNVKWTNPFLPENQTQFQNRKATACSAAVSLWAATAELRWNTSEWKTTLPESPAVPVI